MAHSNLGYAIITTHTYINGVHLMNRDEHLYVFDVAMPCLTQLCRHN
jgi:hypothetical protein